MDELDKTVERCHRLLGEAKELMNGVYRILKETADEYKETRKEIHK